MYYLLLHFEFYFVERNPGQCCKEIELHWSPDAMTTNDMPFPSPAGKYTLQIFQSYEKAVYYNNANEYYIYTLENEWVVSSLTTLFIVCSSY